MKATLTYLCCLISFYQYAQSDFVHVGNQNYHPSSILQLDATDRGILLPKMSFAQINSIQNPAKGLWVYSSGNEAFYFHNGSGWQKMLNQSTANITSLSDTNGDTYITTTNNGNDYDKIKFFNQGWESLSMDDTQISLSNLRDFTIGASSSGPGSRFYFNTAKRALRVGSINGNQWDQGNLGIYSIAFGVNTMASGVNSAAWGFETTATGKSAVSFGQQSLSTGDTSISWGRSSDATNTSATAWGNSTLASGENASAWGQFTNATATGSSAWGSSSRARANYATCFGTASLADGNYGTTWGNFTWAKGNYSSAWGHGTVAESFAETAIGTFNHAYSAASNNLWTANDRIFVVGNGKDFNDTSDAMRIYKNGNTHLYGNDYQTVSADGGVSHLRFLFNANEGFEFKYDGNPDVLSLVRNFGALKTIMTNWTKDGKMGVNRYPVTHILELDGDASKTNPGNWVSHSDRRLKKNIKAIPADEALNKILAMRAVYFEWKNEQKNIKRPEGIQMGFIAQELEVIYPTKVTEDNDGYLMTSYGVYDPIFIAAFKYQDEQIKQLDNQLHNSSQKQNIELDQLQSENTLTTLLDTVIDLKYYKSHNHEE